MQLNLVGNLGADARVENYNGNEFLSFNVAHTSSFVDGDGVRHESTMWVSCTLNGRNERLLPFLVKGQKVFVTGEPSFRVFDSERLHSKAVGVNLRVRSLELVGAAPSPVPSRLYTGDGLELKVNLLYSVSQYKEEYGILKSRDGRPYSVDSCGFVLVGTTAASTPVADSAPIF